MPDALLVKARHEKYLRTEAALAALDQSAGIIATDRNGDRELLIVSGEMQTPEEGALRVSYFRPDGPWGHETRKDLKAIAAAIADHYYKTVRPATEDEVIDWTTSKEFVDGSHRVAFVQAVNELSYSSSQMGHEMYEAARAVIREAEDVANSGDFEAAAKMVQKALNAL